MFEDSVSARVFPTKGKWMWGAYRLARRVVSRIFDMVGWELDWARVKRREEGLGERDLGHGVMCRVSRIRGDGWEGGGVVVLRRAP
jgi:hypothetical protein